MVRTVGKTLKKGCKERRVFSGLGALKPKERRQLCRSVVIV